MNCLSSMLSWTESRVWFDLNSPFSWLFTNFSKMQEILWGPRSTGIYDPNRWKQQINIVLTRPPTLFSCIGGHIDHGKLCCLQPFERRLGTVCFQLKRNFRQRPLAARCAGCLDLNGCALYWCSQTCLQAHSSGWLVDTVKRLCNGHVAGCAYNDF